MTYWLTDISCQYGIIDNNTCKIIRHFIFYSHVKLKGVVNNSLFKSCNCIYGKEWLRYIQHPFIYIECLYWIGLPLSDEMYEINNQTINIFNMYATLFVYCAHNLKPPTHPYNCSRHSRSSEASATQGFTESTLLHNQNIFSILEFLKFYNIWPKESFLNF